MGAVGSLRNGKGDSDYRMISGTRKMRSVIGQKEVSVDGTVDHQRSR